ncbi:MAG TPA: hypothetical protein VN783_12850 [Thermoanaerobaculia bacterium]|nr:hypothetical protein [Thermoanaerobaculia bacterium]
MAQVRPTNFMLGEEQFEFLERRGARSDKGHGPFNRSRILRRKVDLLSEILEQANPVKSGALPEACYLALRGVLDAPWDLKPREITHLDRYLSMQPGIETACQAAGLDPEELYSKLRALSFPEKVSLIDLLEQDLAATGGEGA